MHLKGLNHHINYLNLTEHSFFFPLIMWHNGKEFNHKLEKNLLYKPRQLETAKLLLLFYHSTIVIYT
jgi:hypothetical protein